jgi:hypothetical protein
MWNVPVDHEMFDRISSPQWLWYYFNYAKDQEDEFERSRDFVEYQASFIEPQAVQKIRDARNNTSVEGRYEDSQFDDNVKKMFGREVRPNQSGAVEGDLAAALNNQRRPSDMDSRILKSDYWKTLE